MERIRHRSDKSLMVQNYERLPVVKLSYLCDKCCPGRPWLQHKSSPTNTALPAICARPGGGAPGGRGGKARTAGKPCRQVAKQA